MIPTSFRMTLLASALSIVMMLLITCTSRSAEDYTVALSSARGERIETEMLVITWLSLGPAKVGTNQFTATVINKTNRRQSLALELRAHPGLWLRSWHNQRLFQIEPSAEQRIEMDYEFETMSSEAWLRVTFAEPKLDKEDLVGLGSVHFRKVYDLGKGNPAVNYDLSQFEHYPSQHYDFYYFKGSSAGQDIEGIVKDRESAFDQISALFNVKYQGKIKVFFFPDEETKRQETGHSGFGWAFGNHIVEVYNEQIQLDPFHEVAHIIGEQLGTPPALFHEGFAVYVSEYLGFDAFKGLGLPGVTVDDLTRENKEKDELLSLKELFAFAEIGAPGSKPLVAYPQTASIVKYLIKTYGLENFRKAYQRLESSADPEVNMRNTKVFQGIYRKPIETIEQEWLYSLSR